MTSYLRAQPKGLGALAPQQGLPTVCGQASCLFGSSYFKVSISPLNVCFSRKRAERHHYLQSSMEAVRNLDHLHSFQAVISENSHFKNKTPWKHCTSNFSKQLTMLLISSSISLFASQEPKNCIVFIIHHKP